MSESTQQFEKRKMDHIRIALDPRSQAEGLSGLDDIQLIHEALPDFDFKEVDCSTSFFSHKLSAPFFISSMTAGHENAAIINSRLAELSANKQILMGVGSQRRELNDAEACQEWKRVRAKAPRALLLGNLGISQIIGVSTAKIQAMIESLEAEALFVHLNPLQECLQPEGTPNFRGGYQAIEALVEKLSIPVIVKEVGCGFSQETLKKIYNLGVYAVDVSGLGGTHWGRVEGFRSQENAQLFQVAKTFENWGISTVQSLLNAKKINENYTVWSSGGVRDGLQTGKLLALGSNMVGIAQPWLKAALEGETAIDGLYEKILLELKVAMFCTGVQKLEDFRAKKVWKWHEH